MNLIVENPMFVMQSLMIDHSFYYPQSPQTLAIIGFPKIDVFS